VEFGARGRTALVPAGFRMITLPGRHGTSVATDAPAAVRAAVTAWDAREAGALDALLTAAQPGDAITLWHVLQDTDGETRARVFERLAALVPPPAGVTRAQALALDGMALRLWWQQLPGSLEIMPTWAQKLWILWLKLAG